MMRRRTVPGWDVPDDAGALEVLRKLRDLPNLAEWNGQRARSAWTIVCAGR